jgi:hypothetical protein
MKKYFFLFYVLLFTILLSSCKTSKTAVATANPDLMSDKILLARLMESNLDFTYYEQDSRIEYVSDIFSVDFNATIRMKKDEYIWASLKKLGLEAARVMITRDSFFLIDRFNSQYVAESIKYLGANLGLPFELSDLQQFIAGNHLISDHLITKQKRVGDNYEIETAGSKYNVYYTLSSEFYTIFSRVFDSNGRNVESSFTNFRKHDAGNLPYSRSYSYSDRSSGKHLVNMSLRSIVIDREHSAKFEIPARYERI